jgi:hypothetical protein
VSYVFLIASKIFSFIEGQQLVTRQITHPKTQIDISNLPSGVYFVRLTSDRTAEVVKFVKL